MRAGTSWIAAVALVVGTCGTCVACGDGGVTSVGAVNPDDRAAARATPAPTLVSSAPAASVLAPSQTTPATITAPLLPPPCAVSDLTFTAASSGPSDLTVIITNGGEWCEANLSQSPNVDPAMEPDVWLDPGTSAELSVAIDDQNCAEPASIDMVGLVVNGAPVAVAIEPVEGCRASLQALYQA